MKPKDFINCPVCQSKLKWNITYNSWRRECLNEPIDDRCHFGIYSAEGDIDEIISISYIINKNYEIHIHFGRNETFIYNINIHKYILSLNYAITIDNFNNINEVESKIKLLLTFQ